MSEPLKSLDEIKRIMDETKKDEQEPVLDKNSQNTAVLAVENAPKAITDISASDIKFSVDTSKSMEAQAEDVVGAMATANAVQDEKVAKDLTDKKADELRAKAEARKRKAEAENIKAETERQKEKRTLYEAVLGRFLIKDHLPVWLMVITTVVLSPIYLLLVLTINVPFGILGAIMDGLDGLVCRYEAVDEKCKPKVRATIWILLVSGAILAIAFIVLKATKVI